MKSLIILGLSAFAAAQITQGSDGSFVCPDGAKAFCAGDSLSSNIIIRCSGTKGQPGNCNDNLAGVPPVGVKTSALCYQSSSSAGDAACSLDGTVYNEDGSTSQIPSGGSSSGGSSSGGATYSSPTTMMTMAAPASTGSSQPANQISDGQVQAPVNQISDGQVQQQSQPVNQIGDGQVQQQAQPVNQIGDGQVQQQAQPVNQIGDGQVQQQASPVTQIGDGQVQAPANATESSQPVNQIGDGQVQSQSNPVNQIGDGQVQSQTNTSSPEAPAPQEAAAGRFVASGVTAAIVAVLVTIAM